jgi:hypothetical protein
MNSILKKFLLARNGLLLLVLSSWSGSTLALTFDLNCQKPETGTAACNDTGFDWGEMNLTDSNTAPIGNSNTANNYLDVLIDLTGTGQKVQEFLLNINTSLLTIPTNNLWRAWLVDNSSNVSEINQSNIEYDPDNITGGGGPNLGFFDLQVKDSNFELYVS